MRKFGLMTMQIETAGQSGPDGKSDGKLTGIMDIHAFQTAILAQRDALAERQASGPATVAGQAGSSDPKTSIDLLSEIRDTLHRIENQASK